MKNKVTRCGFDLISIGKWEFKEKTEDNIVLFRDKKTLFDINVSEWRKCSLTLLIISNDMKFESNEPLSIFDLEVLKKYGFKNKLKK